MQNAKQPLITCRDLAAAYDNKTIIKDVTFEINDGDYVDVIVDSIKATKFFDVQVRVRDDFNVEMHIDTDDANACAIKNGDKVRIIKKK